jgi:serine/threonine-protein kinase RsbW
MPEKNTTGSEQRLTIQSRLDDLELVWPWVESLAAEHAASAEMCFAIQLCLEEAVSNIIRHGYGSQPDGPITVDFATLRGELIFTVEDQAPPFDPLALDAVEETTVPASIDEIPLGGQGIPLLRRFAGSLAYERMPSGNRLTIGFPAGR